MKIHLAFMVLALVCMKTHAQTKRFTLPAHASTRTYATGKVMVKVKEQYKSLFQTSTTARTALPFAIKHVRALAPHASPANSRTRALAFKPVIDINQYFELSFDATLPIEEYINTLYSSGYIEKAEPVYYHSPLLAPDDPAQSQQYYLQTIHAYEAWNITQGSEDIVIAIIDTGGDLDHPDLASQLYINENDPVNGIDDDHNGYVDDYRGWDFSGNNAADVGTPGFVGDNDPSIYSNGSGYFHGTAVASCASAATNNAIGVAGVGFKTKLLFTKHFSDVQSSTNYSSNAYEGLLYAAHQGARILNCSWGSAFKSDIYQDIITYVTLDLGCLVVAAAGNSNNDVPIYPAAYDHVLSVAATDASDNRAWFSNYGPSVDISAPGANIYFATYNNSYGTDHGTSFSAPIVAGAAALVWARHPEYTPLQVAAQLRITADADMYEKNPAFAGKLGKGRLNVYNALTVESPSLTASNATLTPQSGSFTTPGEKANVHFTFTNHLKATSSQLSISIVTNSPYIAITKDEVNPAVINTGTAITNATSPFELIVTDTVPFNHPLQLTVIYTDGNYTDEESFTLVLNPSYLDISENGIATSLSAAGRIGFDDVSTQRGTGFVFQEHPMLFEMGLIMGSSPTAIRSAVRGNDGEYHADFVSLTPIQKITPGERSGSEVFGIFTDAQLPQDQTVNVSYRSLVWKEAPRDRFIIFEYKIHNAKANPLKDFYIGLFADWDISPNGANDAAQWNTTHKLGYAFAKHNTALPFAGIQLLSGNPLYYAIDNDPSIAGNPFGIYDGFSDEEKFKAISSISKTEAGAATAGNDVSHVVSSGPYNLNTGEEITIAFALHAATNYDDLVTSAQQANIVYNYTLKAPTPIADNVTVCDGTPATLSATGATAFAWYTSFTGGEPIATTPSITLNNPSDDSLFYVANADAYYESVRTPVRITTLPNPVAGFTMSNTVTTSEPIFFTDASTNAQSWAWNFGDNTTSNEQHPSHAYTHDAQYQITLSVTAANGCKDSFTRSLATITQTESQSTDHINVYPIPTSGDKVIIESSTMPTGEITLLLFDTTGNLLLTNTLPAQSTFTLDISSYPQGLYILQFHNKKTTATRKLIIR